MSAKVTYGGNGLVLGILEMGPLLAEWNEAL